MSLGQIGAFIELSSENAIELGVCGLDGTNHLFHITSGAFFPLIGITQYGYYSKLADCTFQLIGGGGATGPTGYTGYTGPIGLTGPTGPSGIVSSQILTISGELNYTDFQPDSTTTKQIQIATVPIGYTPMYGIIENVNIWTKNMPSMMFQVDMKLFFGLNNDALIIDYPELAQPVTNLSNRYQSSQSTVLPNVYDRNTTNPLFATITVQAGVINDLISGKLNYIVKFIKTSS